MSKHIRELIKLFPRERQANLLRRFQHLQEEVKRQQELEKRKAALDAMVRLSEEMGLYEDPLK